MAAAADPRSPTRSRASSPHGPQRVTRSDCSPSTVTWAAGAAAAGTRSSVTGRTSIVTPSPHLGLWWPAPAGGFGGAVSVAQSRQSPPKGSVAAEEESRWAGWSEQGFREKHWRLVRLLPYPLAYTLVGAVCAPRMVDRLTDYFDGSEAHAAVVQSYWDAGGQVVAFLIAPLLGRLSDAHGRKWFLSWCALCFSLPPLALALSTDVYYYLPARSFSFIGMGGALGAVFLLPAAVDLYPIKQRAVAVALVNSALAAGVCFAPLTLIHVRDSIAFGAAAGVGFLTAIYMTLTPETLAPELRRPFVCCPAAGDSLEAAARGPRRPGNEERRCLMLGLSYIAFASTLAEIGLADVQNFYLKDQLDFTDEDLTSLSLEQGLVIAFGQSLFFLLMKRILRTDVRVLVFGLMGTVVFFMFAAMANAKWGFFAVVIPFQAVSLLVFPTVASVGSSLYDGAEQGEGLGLLACARGLSYACGPIAFSQLYAQLKDYGLANAPFLLAAALNLVAVAIAVCCVMPRLARTGNSLLETDSDSEALPGSGSAGLLRGYADSASVSAPASPALAVPGSWPSGGVCEP
eukprot:TRINITY_DN55486_c0_g1_i1.p1 TRINITY_DN55486_c0_g1~~TRINITY_DN55486_c0_g1_i1.p1  ORF type:complete len:599 (+),score=138.36 TRINITY_DN55486_c0_g1_i1:83-1798(+)